MSRLGCLLLLSLLTLSVIPGCATRRPPFKPVAFNSALEVYPSGLRLLVQHTPQAPRATVYVSYAAGTVSEPPGKEGLAILVSRLTFVAHRGAGPASRLDSQVLAAGATYDAHVGPEDTGYTFSVPPDRLARLMALQAQRLRDPLEGLTEAEFTSVRDAFAAQLQSWQDRYPVLEELRLLHASLLPGHPYGRMSGATAASVRALTLEDARSFARTHLTPAHTVLVVSGPLPPQEVKFEVARAFAGMTGAGVATRVEPVSA
ncbi:insulinase family protein, partial [Pyxidicoccus fallax]